MINQPSTFIMSAEGRAFVYVVARAFLFFAQSGLQLDEETAWWRLGATRNGMPHLGESLWMSNRLVVMFVNAAVKWI